MSKILLVGASSAIAQALQEKSNKEFISLSRSANTLDLDGDLSELMTLDQSQAWFIFRNYKFETFCHAEGRRLSC